jgi:hypothetical protein
MEFHKKAFFWGSDEDRKVILMTFGDKAVQERREWIIKRNMVTLLKIK